MRQGSGGAKHIVGAVLARALALAMAAVAVLGSAADAGAQDAKIFRIGTAGTAGTYFQIGGAIAGAISSPPGSPECTRPGSCGVPGLVAIGQATQGSIENVQLLARGQIESAFVQADVAHWAYTGREMFRGAPPIEGLRAIAALFPEAVHLVAAADGPVRSLADLKGRKVGLGEPESGTLADARLVLAAAGLKEQQITAYYYRLAQATAALRDGSLDAFFQVGAPPVPGIAELAAAMPVRLLPIPPATATSLRTQHRFFADATIPAGAYPGIDEETPTLAIRALWVTTADQPEPLIYAITRALWQESTRKVLQARHPAGAEITLDRALDGLGIPLHPGAERFYREAGLSIETPRQ
jgi:TRAP transporter TAXI family solute receptor